MAAQQGGPSGADSRLRTVSRLQPREVHDTIPLPVNLSHPLSRLLVLALAAWMSFCCCEKRMIAHAVVGVAGAAPSCCERDCCTEKAEDAGDDCCGAPSGHEHEKPGCCADGCCAKAAPVVASFTLDLDQIGAALPPSFEQIAFEPTAGRVLSHEDRAVGEPPPRLALVISRRLRI